MAKRLEKEYDKLSEEEFSKLPENIRNNPMTVHFFDNTYTPYFFLPDGQTLELFLRLHRDRLEFDTVFSGFSEFGRKQLIQSFLIEEIKSTNGIENIHSTRHDIFKLIQSRMNSGEKNCAPLLTDI